MCTKHIRFACFILVLSVSLINGQWIQTSGPQGGSVQDLASDGDILYAGGTGSGVFVSSDKGESWSAANNGLSSLRIRSLAARNGVVFAGTEDNGIFRSTDKGAHWTGVNTGLPVRSDNFNPVDGLAMYGSTVFCSFEEGIYISGDNGDQWKKTGSQFTFSFSSTESRIYASCFFGGSFVSTDTGKTWQDISENLPSESGKPVLSTIECNDMIFCTVWQEGLYRSSDNGITWSTVSTEATGNEIYTLMVSDGVLYAGTEGNGIFRSTDNGITWLPVDCGTNPGTIHTIVPHGNLLFAGCYNAGILRSEDEGLSWTTANSGVICTGITGMVFENDVLAATTGNGTIFESNDMGMIWKNSVSAIPEGLRSHTLRLDDNSILQASYDGIIRYEENDGQFEPADTAIKSKEIYTLTAADGAVFAGTNQGVYRSVNNGISWDSLGPEPSEKIISWYIAVYRMKIDSPYIYICGAGVPSIYRSDDFGTTWQDIDQHGLPSGERVEAIGMHNGTLFAAVTPNKIFRSDSRGDQWVLSDSDQIPLPDNGAAFTSKGDALFLTTSEGRVYVTTDNGISWKAVHTDVDEFRVNMISVDNNYIWAGTNARGVWQRPLSDFVGVTKPTPRIKTMTSITPEATLVKDKLNLEIFLPAPQKVSVTVHNLSGQRITSLHNSNLSAGHHILSYGLNDFSRGYYVILFRIGAATFRRNLVIVC